MNKNFKNRMRTIVAVILFAVFTSACGRLGTMNPIEAPSMSDPVARFPDEPVQAVDENGNWIDPPPPPEPQPYIPPVASYSYSGAGN